MYERLTYRYGENNEHADFITIYCYGHCAYQDDCAAKGLDHDTCIKGVIDWLKQPAKEEYYE